MYDYKTYQMDILQEALETFEANHSDNKMVMDVIDDVWDVTINITTNPRIKRFFGRYWPAKRLIEMVPHKFHGNLLAYKDTVLHELAHHIAHTIYGDDIKPHGYEWQNVCRILGCNDFVGKSLADFSQEWSACHNIDYYKRYKL